MNHGCQSQLQLVVTSLFMAVHGPLPHQSQLLPCTKTLTDIPNTIVQPFLINTMLCLPLWRDLIRFTAFYLQCSFFMEIFKQLDVTKYLISVLKIASGKWFTTKNMFKNHVFKHSPFNSSKESLVDDGFYQWCLQNNFKIVYCCSSFWRGKVLQDWRPSHDLISFFKCCPLLSISISHHYIQSFPRVHGILKER